MKKIFKILIKLFVATLILLSIFLIFSTLTDYKPELKTNLFEKPEAKITSQNNFNILSWNIGYAGLGNNMDFFYDGGKKTRDTKKRTVQNLNQIINFLSLQNNIDFMLLQEVDVEAKRTYYINERDSIEKKLPNFLSIYADNYLVNFVPVPVSDPMGYVQAGLQFLSKPIPNKSTRYSFPGNYSWPTSLFMLDRCFICNRYKIGNQKELIIINTHNSAFDDGSLKKQQLKYLRDFLEIEYQKGNYFIVGGDWNQNPLGFNNKNFSNYRSSEKFSLSSIDKNTFPSDWKFVFDPTTPTNRSNITPYKKGETATTVLDFFLISPNVKPNFITAINLDFKNSDHQPIIMNFELQ